jgi:DNA repair exonuclease SbcCD ATPase subunit
MKLHRLHAASFAAIREADIEFGPGLNILYGPNDLGKSTLVAAIRLALLLPHDSTHSAQYVGWNGAEDPRVELTFETEAQRIWRVKKVFGKSGLSLLQESKNGRDFDDVERGRKVDGRIREILRWGIPEPGGAGAGKGLPKSFLATALLSTQSDVSAVLDADLQGDPAASGKEQIAAALQAVAQDPLFVALLRSVQEKRDQAYSATGLKKTARGSIFKAAADRVNEARKEMEQLQKIVSDSEGAERQLRDLSERRSRGQDEWARAAERAVQFEKLAAQAADRAAAAEQIRLAREDAERIEKLGRDADAAALKLDELAKQTSAAEEVLEATRIHQAAGEAALLAAEEAARSEDADAGLNETVARQQHELRIAALDRAADEAKQRIEAAAAAAKAARERDDLAAKADAARAAATRAEAAQKAIEEDLRRCDLLERALEFRATAARATLAARRAGLNVPPSSALGPMRRLETELAAARATLAVGLVVTVTPYSNLDLRIRRDQSQPEPIRTEKPLKIEARTEVEVAIAEIASVRVRAGLREAQEKAEALEARWAREVAPVLTAAGVADIEGLDAKVTESRDLDAAIRTADAEIAALRARPGELGGAAGDAPAEAVLKEAAKLGADAAAGLRKRRAQLMKELDAARGMAGKASNDLTLAAERARNAQTLFDAAAKAFPEGPDAALASARKTLADAIQEKDSLTREISKLETNAAARKKRVETAVASARDNAGKARAAVTEAQQRLTAAIGNRALQDGQLIQLRKMRDAEDPLAARKKLQEAVERHSALPVPERIVTADEVAAARDAAAGLKGDLETIERDLRGAQLVLEHVGGAVAREQLRDATEAFELATQYEREVEAEYEAWKLLLEQMKEADAAQASNLGQTLAPFIARGFEELTQRRYQNVRLTAQLGTEGVVAAGAVRSPSLISVGTREQLSTLYRLSLAEYLQTAIVLDDQLVQSDEGRMGWFRNLLTEKARLFQIVVVTCRPGDYLESSELTPEGKAVYADSAGGFVRAIDLGRAVQRGN